MTNELRLTTGSHTHSVARLELGQCHSIARALSTPADPTEVSSQRTKLNHQSTSVIGRVVEKLNERRYGVTTGVMVAGDNRFFAVAIIERTR